MQGAFYGIGAGVIAIIARSAVKLVRMTLTKDWLLWCLFGASAVVTAWTEREIVWLFLGSGIVVVVLRARPRLRGSSAPAAMGPWPWLVTRLTGAASVGPLWTITW